MLLPRSIRSLPTSLAASGLLLALGLLPGLLLGLSLGCAVGAGTREPEVPVDAFRLTEEKAFFWAFIPPGEQDVRLYLLGSIHVFDAPLALGPKLDRALSAADVLALEIDFREFGEEEFIEQMIRYGILEWRERLEDFVSRETIAELREYLERRDAGPEEVESMMALRPWASAMIIEQQARESSGLKAEYGVEAYLLARAEAIPVVGLETPDEQFYELSSHSGALEEALLRGAIRAAGRANLNNVLAAWKEGDPALLEKRIFGDEPMLADYHESLIFGRNERMADALIDLIEENPDTVYFAAVGVAHVIGESNIPSLLEAEGFAATDTGAPLARPSP